MTSEDNKKLTALITSDLLQNIGDYVKKYTANHCPSELKIGLHDKKKLCEATSCNKCWDRAMQEYNILKRIEPVHRFELYDPKTNKISYNEDFNALSLSGVAHQLLEHQKCNIGPNALTIMEWNPNNSGLIPLESTDFWVNGRCVFEHDIVKRYFDACPDSTHLEDDYIIGVVVYKECQWWIDDLKGHVEPLYTETERTELLDNYHVNPYILWEEEKLVKQSNPEEEEDIEGEDTNEDEE